MTVQKIALFFLLGAGVAGGSAAGIYHLSKDKTIKDSLIRRDVELINGEDEFGATFLKWKNNEGFRTTIGNILDSTTFQVGQEVLKAWCETNLKLELTNKEAKDKLPKVEEYCSKQILNIEERFTKGGKKLIANDGWATKYGGIKSTDNTLATDLNTATITEDSTNTKAGQALQTWCNKNIKTQLISDKDEEIYKKVENRCLQK